MESTKALSYSVQTNTSDAEIVRGLMPVFDDQRKTEFLVLRTCLSMAEARAVLGVSVAEYNGWRNNDQAFYDWDVNHFHKIRGAIASQVLKARFMRNVFLQLNIDSDLLTARAFAPETMTKEDREESREAGKRYGPQGVATMLKLLESSEDEAAASSVHVEIDIKLDGDHVEQYTAKKAKARALLDWANQKSIDQAAGTIEGTYQLGEVVSSDGS